MDLIKRSAFYTEKDLYIVDFSKVKRCEDMHRAIKNGLDFPDCYAENWGSFNECLNDMSDVGLNFVFRGVEVIKRLLPENTQTLLNSLREYKRKNEYGYCITVKIEDNGSEYYIK